MEVTGVRKGDWERILPVTNVLNLMKIQKRFPYTKERKGRANHCRLSGAKKNLNTGLLRDLALK